MITLLLGKLKSYVWLIVGGIIAALSAIALKYRGDRYKAEKQQAEDDLEALNRIVHNAHEINKAGEIASEKILNEKRTTNPFADTD